ncbi:hypothetical protein IC757_03730 [Wenzhouxiangella sp. AB-CW3]|uniref:DP-EP family protein n=1 Tax=Wenzhouxiangella sp. AB-CW3 TaxID=2771012 RepID=UPI00168B3BE2|nr:DP-EP family protein [Wenzhouxiangella sp. AB-CW3]QOC23272.1 hypothetical protein IC757_03730 [Wenzhouxiangella sp. AB-CW3]
MSNTPVTVTIANDQPPYRVTLNPPGPYRITEPNSTITMQLDEQSAGAGFKMFGIGFREPEAEDQLHANVTTTRHQDDTLRVTDAKTENGRFEFVVLYQDQGGGTTVYGYDPEVDNDD